MQKLIEYWGADARGINSEFADMQAAGATWARVSLPYGAAGAAGMARVVSAARAHHVRLVVVLGKPGNQKDVGTAANRAAYRSWVTGTVRRFKASVKYWEVLNEPNLRSAWSIDNRPGSNQAAYAAAVRRYVTLLADGYRSVKAADRTAVVLFGGLSESTVERYLGVLLTTSAWRYFDVMSYHPFGRTPALVTARYTAFSTRFHARSAVGPEADLGHRGRLQHLVDQQGRLRPERGAQGPLPRRLDAPALRRPRVARCSGTRCTGRTRPTPATGWRPRTRPRSPYAACPPSRPSARSDRRAPAGPGVRREPAGVGGSHDREPDRRPARYRHDGRRMAANIAGAGLPLRVWNRTRDKAEPLDSVGATVAGTPAEAVRGADVVLTMLFDADSVAATMEQAREGLTPGTVWLQQSTVGVEGSDRLVTLAA